MKLLAIDSSGNQTSIALIYEDELLSFSKTHSRMERPNWNSLLNSVGINSEIKISDIDFFAFGRGPGSYTGIRSLASFMKGLSWTQAKPLIGISNLKSIAYQAQNKSTETSKVIINVAIKSDLDEIYFCSYANTPDLDKHQNEKVIAYEDISKSNFINDNNAIFAGNGWDDPRITFEKSNNLLALSSDAESIAQLAKFQFNKSKSFSPHDANPVYLKNTNYKKISNE